MFVLLSLSSSGNSSLTLMFLSPLRKQAGHIGPGGPGGPGGPLAQGGPKNLRVNKSGF